jgi:niacin transporter
MFMPIKYVDGVFSATLASHTPIILAMFINPYVAAGVCIGSVIGFAATLGPIVALRASMHIPFALVGSVMIKKKRPLWLVIVVTTLLHAGAEALIIWVLSMVIGMQFLKDSALSTTLFIVFFGTIVHYLVDFLIAMGIYKPLEKNFFRKLQ